MRVVCPNILQAGHSCHSPLVHKLHSQPLVVAGEDREHVVSALCLVLLCGVVWRVEWWCCRVDIPGASPCRPSTCPQTHRCSSCRCLRISLPFCCCFVNFLNVLCSVVSGVALAHDVANKKRCVPPFPFPPVYSLISILPTAHNTPLLIFKRCA